MKAQKELDTLKEELSALYKKFDKALSEKNSQYVKILNTVINTTRAEIDRLNSRGE